MRRNGLHNFSAALLLVCGVILVLINTVLEDYLIIRIGVRATVLFQRLFVGVAILGFALLLVANIPVIKAQAEKKRQQRRELELQQQQARARERLFEGGDDPKAIREKLSMMRREKWRDFQTPFNRCIEQLDQMDMLQERQRELLQMNGAEYLQETVSVVDNVERRICRNIQNIINLCIVAGGWKKLNQGKVEKIFDDNERKLDEVQGLLEISADLINKYNSEGGSDRRELENWIASIKESLEED